MDPPVPFPNTEVKRHSADDTEPARVWENRSLPGDYFNLRASQSTGPLLLLEPGKSTLTVMRVALPGTQQRNTVFPQ